MNKRNLIRLFFILALLSLFLVFIAGLLVGRLFDRES